MLEFSSESRVSVKESSQNVYNKNMNFKETENMSGR